MDQFRIRKSVLGAGALLLITTAATACTTGSANAVPATTVSGSTVAHTISESATTTTTTEPPTTTTTTHSAVAAGSSPTIYTCEGTTVSEPSDLALACADQKMGLGDMHWSHWGAPTAYATGTFWEYDCEPNCATGKLVSVPTSVTITGLANGHYGRLHVTATPVPAQPHDYILSTVGPGAE